MVGRENPYIRQIAGQSVKIKSVTDNKIGGNVETDIIRHERGNVR